MELTAYLHFDGQCQEAFKAYERIFRGTILMMLSYADVPASDNCAPGSADRIMHARLQAGTQLLMGSDHPTGCGKQLQGFSVAISVKDPAEAERIYSELAEGGTVFMPIGETFFAHRFAMLTDRFGTPWMVSCEKAQQTSGSPPRAQQPSIG